MGTESEDRLVEVAVFVRKTRRRKSSHRNGVAEIEVLDLGSTHDHRGHHLYVWVGGQRLWL